MFSPDLSFRLKGENLKGHAFSDFLYNRNFGKISYYIKKHSNFPLLLKKFIFLYKNIFNIITKKKIEDANIWVLPIQEKYSFNTMNNILKRLSIYKENIYVFPENMYNKEILNLLGIKDGKQIISCLVIGYPDVKYQRTVPRKEANINWL